MTVEELFLAVVEMAPAERVAHLDVACAADVTRRAQVEALLRAHEQAGSVLEQPLFRTAPGGDDTRPWPNPWGDAFGQVIEGYKLVEQIGEGGMGAVWMAQQTEPVKRLVAVKLIKAGLDSKQVLARFEAERQALALMDHPNIAKVLDAGTTSAGRPYFVMELVKGVPITKYCDEHRLTPRQRLELFVPVCRAVQHAHQKGIIHRDLKPANVLIALYDGRPVPKVIDFGVAKAAGLPLTDKTLVTGFGAIVGTLEYMAPEQAEVNQLDVDTRSDVYSLGILLYELLTGSPPFTRTGVGAGGLMETLRVIREQEPTRPSTKLASADGLPALAACRGIEPAKLSRLVRGELDWIVMKALEKDRNRRYETADAFAADVQRYLADEAVMACPPSVGYRVRKFARRNTVAMSAVSATLLALLIGIAGTTAGLLEARTQRDAAEDARKAEATEARRAVEAESLASQRLAQAETERQRADDERAIAQAVSDFLQKDLLGQAAVIMQGAGAKGDSNITVRTALDRATSKVGQRFANQPRVEAAIRVTLARVYQELGLPNEARPQAERSVELRLTHLGPDHADTMWSQVILAMVYYDLRLHDRMEAMLIEVIRRQTDKLGPRHLDTLTTKNVLASFSLDAFRPNLPRAAELLQEVVQGRANQLGPEHPETLVSKQNLAWLYRRQGEYDRAATLFRELLDVYRIKFGEDYTVTLLCKSNLGLVHLAGGKLELAEPLLVEVLQKRNDQEGADGLHTNSSRHFLSKLYRAQRKYDQAVPLMERVLIAYRKAVGNHESTLIVMSDLAQTHLEARQPDKALPLIEEFLRGHQDLPDPDSLFLAGDLADIGLLLVKNDRCVEAERHLRRSLAIHEKKGVEDWSTFDTRSKLGAALLGQKKNVDAEPLLRQGYEGMKRREADIPPGKTHLTEAAERLVRLYDQWNRPDEAAKWRKELDGLVDPPKPPAKPKGG